MTSPSLNNPDPEDDHHNFVIPFQESDDLWKLLEDDRSFLGMEDPEFDETNLFDLENYSAANVVEAADTVPGVLLLHEDESGILPTEHDDHSSFEWDSFMLLQQKTAEISGTPSKIHEITNGGCSDPSTLVEQGMPVFYEPTSNIDTELMQNLVNYSNDDIFSDCFLGEESNTELQNNIESAVAAPTSTNNEAAPLLGKQQSDNKSRERNRNTTTIEEHNAKERVRRMKLYGTYLSLGELLPHSQATKKKRSAPAIIDRALEYIPELENEIEKLTLKKNNAMSTIENQQTLKENQEHQHQHQETPSVLVHEVKKGEVIIQIIICNPKDEEMGISKLLQKLESNGASIVSVSTLQASEKSICYHIHLQMNKVSLATDYVAVLREDVISLFFQFL